MSVALPGVHPHPVVHLARTHLTGSSRIALITHVPGVAPGDFHEAVARHGAGLDHPGGETPLALIKLVVSRQGADRGYNGTYIVSDRRIFGRVQSAGSGLNFTNVEYGQLTGPAVKSGGLAPGVLVPTGNQQTKLFLAPKQLQAYLDAMVATVPTAHRTFGPPPPPPRSPEEVVTALGSMRAVATPDPRTWVPARALSEAHRRGMVDPAQAAALVPQMTQLAHAVAYGRGSCPAGWRTVLPRSALAAALKAVLGTPIGARPAPGGEVVDFDIHAGSGKGRAAASSVVGLAMLATVGVGWVSTSNGQRLTGIRVQTADLPDGTAFQLHGMSGPQLLPLSMHWWRAVDTVHQAVFRFEARYLLGRALFGTTQPPDALAAMPREALTAHAARILGPLDLTTFYPSS